MEYVYIVVTVSPASGSPETIYSLSGTRYGRLLLVFRGPGELEIFSEYARQSVKPGFVIKTVTILANGLEQFHEEVQRRSLLPSGPSRVAVEGTDFFDEVIAELMADTIWADET